MDKPNIPKQLVKAVVSWFAALLVGWLLSALGAGRAFTAAASGAAGGLAGLAVN